MDDIWIDFGGPKDETILFEYEVDGAIQYTRATQWQPIETAPKDGRIILAGNENGTWPAIYRRESVGGDFYELGSDSTPINATHWMPLPQPPEDTK